MTSRYNKLVIRTQRDGIIQILVCVYSRSRSHTWALLYYVGLDYTLQRSVSLWQITLLRRVLLHFTGRTFRGKNVSGHTSKAY